jgi:aspartyl-tRNA(Asn)/glutamyl-tRNA(Gln) amidotransferase subunit B
MTDIQKTIANIITVNLMAICTKKNLPIDIAIASSDLIKIATLFEESKINNQGLNKLLELYIESNDKNIDLILTQNNLLQTTDMILLENIVSQIIEQNPTQIEQYKSGKVQVIGFLVGQCMKEAKGQGNPKIFNEILQKLISI